MHRERQPKRLEFYGDELDLINLKPETFYFFFKPKLSLL